MAKRKTSGPVEKPAPQKPEQRYVDGKEMMDPVPMAPPININRRMSLTDRVRELVRSESLKREAENAQAETFEEADDFDVGDDYDPSSPYEEVFEPDPQMEAEAHRQTMFDKWLTRQVVHDKEEGSATIPDEQPSEPEPESANRKEK